MTATDYETARAHLISTVGFDLADHVDIPRKYTLKTFALLGTLVVVYRYAEATGKRLIVYDMTASGKHKSHHLGTELDFDLSSPDHDAIQEANIVSDLLRMRETLRSDIAGFRIGFYFDHFKNTDADTFDKFKDMYGDRKLKYSLHLGVRYKWTSPEYEGKPASPGTAFAFWGKETVGYYKDGLWARRIRSWNIGFLKDEADNLARDCILNDLRVLDAIPPGRPAP